ncbi:MAG: hypothetical protein GYA36_22460, partial [Veillonellaceae bacterium]|nr:hypothetical protein [Veillonellaceae bacterium]
MRKRVLGFIAFLLLTAFQAPASAVEPVGYVVYNTLPTYFNTLEEGMKAFSGIRDQISTSGGQITSVNLSREAVS